MLILLRSNHNFTFSRESRWFASEQSLDAATPVRSQVMPAAVLTGDIMEV